MSNANMIKDVVDRLFREQVDKSLLDSAETGVFPDALWQAIRETGFHEVGTEASGTGTEEMFALLDSAGEYAVPLPLAEVLLANIWLGSSDELTLVGVIEGDRIVDIPWGRKAKRVLGIGTDEAVLVTTVSDLEEAQNLAGEPRDSIAIGQNASPVELPGNAGLLLAAARAVQAAGAMRAVLEMTITYATDREQFGRTISKFQAIQHTLAVMAAEVAAAQRASDAAVAAFEREDATVDVAIARSRIGEASGVVAESAHQVHGAMGFTHEHHLHHHTRRLWAWRDEYGNETSWERRLGHLIAAKGADNLWGMITAQG